MIKAALKLVYSDRRYIVISAIISIVFFVPLAILAEYIFTTPYLVLHVTFDNLLGFALILIVSAMSGLVIGMNVYRIRLLQQSRAKMGGGLLGSIIGASAGACSCGSVGFAVISTFGTVGGIATAFLSNYEIPLRLLAIAILGYTYFATTKSLIVECKIKKS
ncbi:MAG: hypothetical protein ABI337_06755 [Nitrososphaera sp.]|jgi:hypothetical protein